jgi:hypothetical protein
MYNEDTGEPLAGVTVHFGLVDSTSDPTDVIVGKTDANGHFDVMFNPKEYSLRAAVGSQDVMAMDAVMLLDAERAKPTDLTTQRFALLMDDGKPCRAVANLSWHEAQTAEEQLKGNPRH